ncbi:MAG: hypothetical protein GDA50_07745, partial [Alphaproteobacteria bacterium GM202ARS2]|nr:hypothetical protein [Alphaproteobacteria bacterium GM202ARS2]
RALIQHSLKHTPTATPPANSLLVLVARKKALTHPFNHMCQDLDNALAQFTTPPQPKPTP